MRRERDSLVLGRVIGDVLDHFERSVNLSVTYNRNNDTSSSSSCCGREVTNGCERKPSQVVNHPRVDIGGCDLRTFYTLVNWSIDKSVVLLSLHLFLISVSATVRNSLEFPYRLVTDIPATTGASYGQEMVCYESPRPAVGIHRFVFVLFRQLGRETVYAPGWRQNFNTRDFAELYNLGDPVAATYFNCQRESGSGGRRRP
ncbi:hypothetical protein RHMOL_Rhmol09G0182300 [Rhododendron molle]|uniref:Uncharacterized protein n=1 Tax=Rhododendron molle TaxID=49168 RepID=A0ACC0MEG7_RHOML|nr:hypothetical protein RHMOL_Rhmol09G0182300 [Rhododendron molle]